VNKVIKSLLRTGLFLLEQSDAATSDMRERVRDSVEDISNRTRRAIRPQQNYVLRDVLAFAAGVSLGVGVGILFAPASGEETRSTLAERMQGVGTKVRDKFSSEVERAAG
jgi:hypothetical protein